MAIMGHFLHIYYISCEKNRKCHRGVAWKLWLRSLFRSWKNDYLSRDARLSLQNGTYAAIVSLFTSGTGNANFSETCFSISSVFWDLILRSSAFSSYFSHNWERYSIFLVFQGSHSSKGKHAQPALLSHISLALLHMQERVTCAQ